MTTFENAHFVNVEQTGVAVVIDGEVVVTAADPGNPVYADLVSSGVVIAPFPGWRQVFLKRVDDDAEAIRARYNTPGAGMAYAEKHAQARAALRLGEEAANAMEEEEVRAQFPMLWASLGIDAPTLWDVVMIVIDRAERWVDTSSMIERTRKLAKKAISEASDAAAARAAYEAVRWP